MTAAALSNELKSILSRSGADDPAADSELIMESALGLSHLELMLEPSRGIPPEERERAVAMARRRAAGEPIQYILGVWPFMGRDYRVGEGVLIPRDDTEVVVRAATDILKGVPSPIVVDLCSGTGIIAVTLKKELGSSTVSAVEKSGEAFGYLSENTRLNEADIRLIHADLRDCAGDFPDHSLDMIISNPPYIKSGEIAGLQREISFEPRLALDGGESGYDFYELIIGLWTDKLKAGGAIALELGEGQYERVAEMLKENGYTDIKGYPDIQGITRAVTAVLVRSEELRFLALLGMTKSPSARMSLRDAARRKRRALRC